MHSFQIFSSDEIKTLNEKYLPTQAELNRPQLRSNAPPHLPREELIKLPVINFYDNNAVISLLQFVNNYSNTYKITEKEHCDNILRAIFRFRSYKQTNKFYNSFIKGITNLQFLIQTYPKLHILTHSIKSLLKSRKKIIERLFKIITENKIQFPAVENIVPDQYKFTVFLKDAKKILESENSSNLGYVLQILRATNDMTELAKTLNYGKKAELLLAVFSTINPFTPNSSGKGFLEEYLNWITNHDLLIKVMEAPKVSATNKDLIVTRYLQLISSGNQILKRPASSVSNPIDSQPYKQQRTEIKFFESNNHFFAKSPTLIPTSRDVQAFSSQPFDLTENNFFSNITEDDFDFSKINDEDLKELNEFDFSKISDEDLKDFREFNVGLHRP